MFLLSVNAIYAQRLQSLLLLLILYYMLVDATVPSVGSSSGFTGNGIRSSRTCGRFCRVRSCTRTPPILYFKVLAGSMVYECVQTRPWKVYLLFSMMSAHCLSLSLCRSSRNSVTRTIFEFSFDRTCNLLHSYGFNNIRMNDNETWKHPCLYIGFL